MTPQLHPHMDQIQLHSASFKQSGINQLDVMRRRREPGWEQGNDIRCAMEWRCWECFPEPCVGYEGLSYLSCLHTIIRGGARPPFGTWGLRSTYVLCRMRGAGCSSDKTVDNMVGDTFHEELFSIMYDEKLNKYSLSLSCVAWFIYGCCKIIKDMIMTHIAQ